MSIEPHDPRRRCAELAAENERLRDAGDRLARAMSHVSSMSVEAVGALEAWRVASSRPRHGMED